MISGIIDRLFAVLGALAFAQAPLFIQQYQQQLLGRATELQLQVDAIRKIAGDRGLDWYVQKFINSSDPDFSSQGRLMREMIQRQADLNYAYSALSESSIWTKPVLFFKTLQPDVCVSTFKHFDLGLPLNLEGALYALVGLLIGMALYRIILALIPTRSKLTTE